MAFAVVLWVTGDAIGVSSVVAAMLGKPSAMSQRLVTRVKTVIKMPMVSSLCMAVQHGRGLRQINARGGKRSLKASMHAPARLSVTSSADKGLSENIENVCSTYM